MPHESNAIEHLRVIRNLMERATVYRAISAPTALVGGLLASALALLNFSGSLSTTFVGSWLVVLVLTLMANTLFLWRDNSREGKLLLSRGLRLAIRAVLPSLLAAVIFSICIIRENGPTSLLSITWVSFYGLTLLSTEQFAPRSLVWLGRTFLFAGLATLFASTFPHTIDVSNSRSAHLIMGVTFGLFHLIYATATWSRGAALQSVQPAA